MDNLATIIQYDAYHGMSVIFYGSTLGRFIMGSDD